MTDTDPARSAREDLAPANTEEAAKIVREDPALSTLSEEAPDADAETDDDARTPDSAPTGEVRDG
jgi:hypothetical protein